MIKRKKLLFLFFFQNPCRISPQHIRQMIHPGLFRLDLFLKASPLRPYRQKPREKFLQRIHQISGPNALPLIVYLAPGKIKLFRRLGHIHIQIEPLNIHLLPRGGGKLIRGLSQEFPVNIGNNPSASRIFRNIPVINARKKQNFDLVQPGSLDISHDHPVHILGNRSHLDLSETRIQNIGEFLHAHFFRAQQGVDLIQEIHH